MRGTGALKLSCIGRMGRQAAWAFSRSQLNSAAKGSRTRYSKRLSWRLARAQITNTSIAIMITDQTGEYGRNRNWAIRLSEARTMPAIRAQVMSLSRPYPVTNTRAPRTTWTIPQPVRLIS